MPVYEYACKACGQHLEVAQSFKDDPLTTCPACGGPLRKVFGSIGISFKGSGFYRTDSRVPARKEKEKETAKADAGASASASGSGSGDGAAAKSSETKSSESKSSDGKSSTAKASA